MLASYICQIENKTVTSNTQDEWGTRLWYFMLSQTMHDA